MAKRLDYTVLDVFAERALEGNPLAVFHDGRGLSTAAMQALAREMNLSEITFVLPTDEPEQERAEGVRVRIFTPTEELPFAGHPTLGTAAWLRQHHPALQGAEELTLQLNIGPVTVRFSPGDGPGVYGTMRQPEPRFSAEYEAAEVAAVLGLEPGDLLPGYRPQIVSTGNAFCIVALRSEDVLGRLHIPQPTAVPWLRARGGRWFYCVAPTAVAGEWQARMQWESGEDPATGSAAGPCIAWMVRVGLAKAGQPVTLLQGVKVQRPSRLFVQAQRIHGQIGQIDVGGRTIPVASGHFLLADEPPYAQGNEPETPIAAGVPGTPVDQKVNAT